MHNATQEDNCSVALLLLTPPCHSLVFAGGKAFDIIPQTLTVVTCIVLVLSTNWRCGSCCVHRCILLQGPFVYPGPGMCCKDVCF